MITSVTNAKVKQLIQLRNRSKVRRETDSFLVEGIRMFREVPVSYIKEVYVTPAFLDKHKEDEKLTSLKYEVVSEEVFERISDTVTPQGVLCVVKCLHYSLEDVTAGKEAFLLMLEDIQDPGNLGTMIRTAEGAGVSGIVMSRGTADIYNPKVIRSTMGSVFRMPFVYVEDMPESIKQISKFGIRVYAAALDGATFYTKENYLGKIAFLIGNEGNGLTKEAVTAATQSVFIPMEGEVESLNASISAAVLMYEASRQRRE